MLPEVSEKSDGEASDHVSLSGSVTDISTIRSPHIRLTGNSSPRHLFKTTATTGIPRKKRFSVRLIVAAQFGFSSE
jgi:hypothetical protein